VVKGLSEIKRAVINKIEKKDALTFELLAEGVGLKEVMATPGVEYTETMSNHILEIYEVLGVEAGR